MKKKIFFVFFGIIMIFFNLSGCKKNKNSPENQIIKYNLDNEPSTLDPQVCNDSSANIIIMNIFEGLVRLDKNGDITPGVASSWDISDNKLSYTFYLRENAAWSDKQKTPVTAQDFVFGFQRSLDSYTKSPKAYTLYCIKNAQKINRDALSTDNLGVKAIDSKTLKIDLEYPIDNFLALLATPPTMPCNKSFFEKTNGQYGLESSTIISNGAFKLKPRYGWDHYNSLNLILNENYSGQNKPIPAGISFSIGKNISDTISLIENSTIDAALLPNENQIDEAKKKNFSLTPSKNTLWILAFNTQDSLFSNFDLRRGFFKALNRNNILSYVPKNFEVANDIILNGLTVNGQNFRNIAGENLYLKEDPQAKNYFDTGLKQLNLKTLPKITILCPDSSDMKTIVSNIIESLNQKLEYYFNMEPISEKSLLLRVYSKNYQVALFPISIDSKFALDFLSIFKSNNNKNFVNFSNSNYDKILNSAAFEHPQSSIKYLIEAEKTLNDNAIIYPMFVQTKFFAHSKKLSNLIFHDYNQGIDFFFATKVK